MDQQPDCPFCRPHQQIKEGDWGWISGVHHNGYRPFWAIPLKPVVPGHVMVIPTQHVPEAPPLSSARLCRLRHLLFVR